MAEGKDSTGHWRFFEGMVLTQSFAFSEANNSQSDRNNIEITPCAACLLYFDILFLFSIPLSYLSFSLVYVFLYSILFIYHGHYKIASQSVHPWLKWATLFIFSDNFQSDRNNVEIALWPCCVPPLFFPSSFCSLSSVLTCHPLWSMFFFILFYLYTMDTVE